MRGSRNFCQGGGGPGPSVIKIPDNVFLVLFCWYSTYFTEYQSFISKKIIIFRGSRGAPTFIQGGWGVQLLIPYWIPYNLCFSRGVRAPCPPPPPPLDQCMQYFAVKKVSYEKKLSILTPPLPWVFLNVYMMSGKTTIVAWAGSKLFLNFLMGAQWLSGRVLDSRPKGHGFKPHWCHCVVVLEQDTFILA